MDNNSIVGRDEVIAYDVTVGNLVQQYRRHGSYYLYCSERAYKASSDANDYWNRPKTDTFTCCGKPMALVRRRERFRAIVGRNIVDLAARFANFLLLVEKDEWDPDRPGQRLGPPIGDPGYDRIEGGMTIVDRLSGCLQYLVKAAFMFGASASCFGVIVLLSWTNRRLDPTPDLGLAVWPMLAFGLVLLLPMMSFLIRSLCYLYVAISSLFGYGFQQSNEARRSEELQDRQAIAELQAIVDDVTKILPKSKTSTILSSNLSDFDIVDPRTSTILAFPGDTRTTIS